MRERYFRMHESIEYKRCFYRRHFDRATRLYYQISTEALVASVVSVLVWSISKTMPALWAIVIACAQFVQAYSVNLPYAKQIASLNYLLPELNKLILQIDYGWLSLDIVGYDDQELLKQIAEHEAKFTALEDQFTNGIKFPEIESILKKAEQDTDAYFKARYTYADTEKEEQINAAPAE